MNHHAWLPLFPDSSKLKSDKPSTGTTQQFQEALDQVNWTPEIIEGLQQAVLSGPQFTFCNANDSVSNR